MKRHEKLWEKRQKQPHTELYMCAIHGFTEHRFSSKGHPCCKKCTSLSSAESRRNKRVKAMGLKGSECLACGYNTCSDALEFHHVNGKKDKIDSKTYLVFDGSFEKIKEKIKNCILLCANCHRELHHSRGGPRFQDSLILHTYTFVNDKRKSRGAKRASVLVYGKRQHTIIKKLK